MKIPLSKRLQACAQMISPGSRIADIGCDHGYLGIYLLKNGIASEVIAADINEMPLQSARSNARRFGVADRIRFFLSDGALSIPRDFDTMICAGMGGDTIISILENAGWLFCTQYHLVLQCQTRTHSLRRYLSEKGWHIDKETVLRDGRFLYTVMSVSWNPEAPRLTAGQHYICPALRESGDSNLPEYYRQICFKLERATKGQGEQVNPDMLLALQELKDNPIAEEKNDDNC